MILVRILSLLFVFLGFTGSAIAAETPSKSEPAKVATEQVVKKVDINKADAASLQGAMVGVGELKAKAIVEYREANGPFSSVDDLLQVKGIGAKTLEANRDRLSVE
ncbi:competence protein ComEA [Metapseudomonas otitidis]|uniref:Competence protein ComEA n=1 Tax=Metapseudomonas otitidis TaxID=319939 RepID=A0A6S5RKQ5_9GAMM|nr:ComEA family DNA-binding protein [Pseudomonas otitidis]BBT15718.1 competence protein ComEA [Pseudomonas otitidis]